MADDIFSWYLYGNGRKLAQKETFWVACRENFETKWIYQPIHCLPLHSNLMKISGNGFPAAFRLSQSSHISPFRGFQHWATWKTDPQTFRRCFPGGCQQASTRSKNLDHCETFYLWRTVLPPEFYVEEGRSTTFLSLPTTFSAGTHDLIP